MRRHLTYRYTHSWGWMDREEERKRKLQGREWDPNLERVKCCALLRLHSGICPIFRGLAATTPSIPMCVSDVVLSHQTPSVVGYKLLFSESHNRTNPDSPHSLYISCTSSSCLLRPQARSLRPGSEKGEFRIREPRRHSVASQAVSTRQQGCS